jgi:uncharacterized cupin superfamily protein
VLAPPCSRPAAQGEGHSLHRHHREDEYSYVLEVRMGALLDDEVLEAGPGVRFPGEPLTH